MKGELKNFSVFIALPAVVLAVSFFAMLFFGTGGFSRELKSASVEDQLERYERNVKDRMARRARAYLRNGKCDYVWQARQVPWGTNVPERVKYGCYTAPDGSATGWARIGDDKVIGFDVEPFRAEEPFRIWAFGIGAVLMLALFLLLSYKGFMLASAAKRTREELEMKNSFLDVVSHELNTPLASIVPLSSALARGSIKDPVRIAHAQETVSRESARMARMIGALLEAVRLRNGRLMFVREPFDLREAAGDAADVVRTYHPGRKITVSAPGRIMAVGDFDKTVQIAVNFLDNACKYGGDGEIAVDCRASIGNRATLSVLDRGQGLPESELRNVFRRFHRSENAVGGGLGLGLNVAEGLAAGMGGRVYAENRKGGGCTFTLELDLMPEYGKGEGANG